MEFEQYLKLDSSIGIFPEGTTNKIPEQQKLNSPIKASAFLFMINSDAWLQPVSIVWIQRTYNIKNRAIINFRPPFKSEGMQVSDIMEKWKETVESGIDENIKIIESLK